MKKLFLLLLPLIAASCGNNAGDNTNQPTDLKVMSFNVRYDNPEDSADNWQYRRDRVADAINFYNADIVGTQEVLYNQLEDLKARLPEYAMVGVGREDGKQLGEYAALWYKTSRFETVDSGNFWLSATPEVEGSLGWDGACVRIASWAILRDRDNGKELFALNTHLDHVGVEARRQGVTLILDRVNQLRAGRPAVVTGDFNSNPQSDVIAHITGEETPNQLTNTRTAAPLVYGPDWTYHDFGRLPYDKRELIDYVFITGPLSVKSYGILAETNGSGFLSDHCPVLVNMIWE